jgi:T-complex protein 1 subunit beta
LFINRQVRIYLPNPKYLHTVYSCKTDTFLSQPQLIYNYPEQVLMNKGVTSIEHADFDGVERLALVTGGEICSTFDDPAGNVLGTCDLVEEIMIGEDKLIKFSGVAKGEACTIVLRGASSHVLGEAERSLHDALCVLTATVKDSRIVYGGGCPEMIMSKAVEELASRTPGKRALAMEGFAKALRAIPTIICENAGLDSSEIISQLKASHGRGETSAGIDILTGFVGDMDERGVTECFRVKQQILLSGTEAAEMIVRVDDIIKCVPRQREQ